MFVLAVSNGLLLSSTSRSSHGCYYICNPLTKQWAALPKPPRIHRRVSLGFIVEPCDGSFQVVRIGGYVGSLNILNFEIFSSKTRQWKEKSVSFDLLVGATVSICHAVSCKKILHWMDHNKIITYDSSQSDDENDETIRCSLIVLPSDRLIHGHSRVGMIGVCRDKLHYFQLANGIHNPNLSSWELRKYDDGGEGEWFLLHRIRFSEVNPAPLQFVQPLALHPFESDLVYLRSSTGIACFNLRTKVVKYCIPEEAIIVWWTVFVFVLPPWPTPVLQISPTQV